MPCVQAMNLGVTVTAMHKKDAHVRIAVAMAPAAAGAMGCKDRPAPWAAAALVPVRADHTHSRACKLTRVIMPFEFGRGAAVSIATAALQMQLRTFCELTGRRIARYFSSRREAKADSSLASSSSMPGFSATFASCWRDSSFSFAISSSRVI